MIEILKPTTVWVDDAAIDTVSNLALKVLAVAIVLLALGAALIISRVKNAKNEAIQASMIYANGVPKNGQRVPSDSDVAVKERE